MAEASARASNGGADQVTIPRGDPFTPQRQGTGYHQCWYPVCMSDEVAPGQVIGGGFLNGRVIVYRGESGRPYVMSAFCRHVGADLQLGDVIGEEIRCPFHHWSYGADGACTRVAAGDKPPPDARLFKFPTEERFGLVWAFNGHEPLYELPYFGRPEEELTCRVLLASRHPAEPYMLLSNSMDFNHLEIVHGMKITNPAEGMTIGTFMIDYDLEAEVPGLGHMNQHIHTFGTNCITIASETMGREMYMCSAAVPEPGGTCRNYNVNATPKSTGAEGEEEQIEQILKASEAFGLQLIKEDTEIVNTMSFRPDRLTAADYGMKIWFDHVREYPRANPAEDLIGHQCKRSANGSA